jgi:hypothetical protein
MKGRILIFMVGVVVGAIAALLLPGFIVSSLPRAPWATAWAAEGTVVAKQWEGESLLLTLLTDEGATLATFKDRVAEIDLLVEEGDQVSFTLRGYRPFVEDPGIRRVLKKGQVEVSVEMEEAADIESPPPTATDEAVPTEADTPAPDETSTEEPTPLPQPEESVDSPPAQEAPGTTGDRASQDS